MSNTRALPEKLGSQGTIKILGIDPGLRCTGFGVIALQGNKPSYIACGQIRTQTSNLAPRLAELFNALQNIINTYEPQVSVIEKVFVNINAQSTLLLGQARGALIASLVYRELPVYEYTALQLKQAVVGYGKAAKSQVQAMVKHLLQLEKPPATDAADALAVALCHVYHQQMQRSTHSSTLSNALAKQLGTNQLTIRRGRIIIGKTQA